MPLRATRVSDERTKRHRARGVHGCKNMLVFYEIQVFEGFAQRTGRQWSRADVKVFRARCCRSAMDLRLKVRRLGDGHYFLSRSSWPTDTDTIDLRDDFNRTSTQAYAEMRVFRRVRKDRERAHEQSPVGVG